MDAYYFVTTIVWHFTMAIMVYMLRSFFGKQDFSTCLYAKTQADFFLNRLTLIKCNWSRPKKSGK